MVAPLVALQTVIGWTGSVAGSVNFMWAFWQMFEFSGPEIQVKVGLEGPGCSQFGGVLQGVAAFDEYNELRGTREFDSENLSPDAPGNDHIGSGETFKTKLNQYEKHIQVRYLSMSNNWDATCYAWVTVQNLDGSASHGTWTGDIGSMCGMKWYPSGQIAGTYEEDGSPWRPRCAWLDAEGDKKWASLKFDVVALGPLEAHHTINSNTICDSMLLSESAAHIEAQVGQPVDHSQKRNLMPRGIDTPRLPWMALQLTISTADPIVNATSLCQDPMSWGPDYVGSDGMMCDMGTRKLHPLCSHYEVDGCLDLDEDAMVLMKRTKFEKRDDAHLHRQYDTFRVME